MRKYLLLLICTIRRNFASGTALAKSYVGNIFFIIWFIFLIGGISVGGDYVAVGVIAGGLCLAMSINQIIKNHKLANDNIIEQAVYESLKRTSNHQYVEFLKEIYKRNKIDREYIPFLDKKNFLQQHKDFEQRDTYKRNMQQFNGILSSLKQNTITKQNKTSEFSHH